MAAKTVPIKPINKCQCKDVEIGSYKNTVLLGYYPAMRSYKDAAAKAGLSTDGICVDTCIAPQVIELWEAGVPTFGSCCGHNKLPGFINVGTKGRKSIATWI